MGRFDFRPRLGWRSWGLSGYWSGHFRMNGSHRMFYRRHAIWAFPGRRPGFGFHSLRGWFRRRRFRGFDQDDWFGRGGSGRRGGDPRRAEVALKIFGGDFVQRARGNASGSNAQLLGFRQDFLVLDSQLLCYVVNTNGHINNQPPDMSENYS